jgi:putative ABC transport system permease protein
LSLAQQFPEVEKLARFYPSESGSVIQIGDIQYQEDQVGFADSTYFDVFSFEFVDGDPGSALTEPGQVVISESTAIKYFGRSNAVGEVLEFAGNESATVSAVFRDVPATTHQPVDLLIPMITFYSGSEEWLEGAVTWAGFHTYLLLRPGVDVAEFANKLPDFVDERYAGELDEDPPSSVVALVLQPLYDIHLHSALEKEYRANSDIRYVYTFAFVAIVVLGIAIINFVNLTTAKSTLRMREVGVRRCFGAGRGLLVRQFLTESVVHAFLGFLVAIGLALLLFPLFRDISGVEVGARVLTEPLVIGAFAAVTLTAGLIAGLYPAVVLSAFRPVQAFRGLSSGSLRGGGLRRALVVGQFAVSIILLAVSAVVWSQLTYMRTAQLGFDKEQVLVIDMTPATATYMTESPLVIREALLEHPSISAVSSASDMPGSRYSVEGMTVVGRNDDATMMRVAWRSDYDYVDALGLELVEGRGFSLSAPTDTSAWILNEAAVRELSLENPTDELLRWGDYVGPIVGVVRDFNFASLHTPVEPLVIPLRPGFGGNLLVRFTGDDQASIVEHARSVIDRVTPGELFDYSFLSDDVDAQYLQEDKLRDVIASFSILGVVVACLGLFGLAAFTADRRTREIGIRKVLGASVGQNVRLLTREFVALVLIAIVVGVPVAYFLVDQWLADFAYRISLSPLYFLAAGLAALAVAVLTVGFQAARAAATNPVHSIRHE